MCNTFKMLCFLELHSCEREACKVVEIDKTGKKGEGSLPTSFGTVPFYISFDAWGDNSIVLTLDQADQQGIKWNLDGKGNLGPAAPIGRDFQFTYEPLPFSDYSRGFDKIRQAQLKGETWLANLTYPAKLHTDLSLSEIVHSAQAPFRLLIPGRIGIFSPERFVRIEESGRISSYPMKGTIDAEVANAKEVILSDEKEAAEHVTIVDLIRNDLSMVARNVHVPRYRYVTEIAAGGRRLLQVSSEVSGDLGRNWKDHLGEILYSLLPAGSVTGAPKQRTCEIIREAEGYDRGWYTGIFGIFDGREFDSAVAIRYVEKDESDALIYKSGGGITINSVVEDEYQEMKNKIYVPIA